MTYTEIVDDIYQYYGSCFLNDLEDTTIRNYEDFVEKVIEENFNSAMTYSVAFERTYDYRDVNMPATIQMMNYILDEWPEEYTVMSKGAQAVISLFAIIFIRNAIHEEMNYEAEFKEHWRRVDEDNDITEVQPCDKCGMDEPHAMWVTEENREWVFCVDCMVLYDKYYETGNAPISVWVNLPIPPREDTDDEEDEEEEDPHYNIDNAYIINIDVRAQDWIVRGITCKHCGFELPEMLMSEHSDKHNPKNNCLCTDDDKKKYSLYV